MLIGRVCPIVMSREFAHAVGNRIETELYSVLVEDLFKHYYTEGRSVSPIIFWWLGLNLISSIPVSLYSHITGVETIPASHPLGALMFITMVGGLVAMFVAHFALWGHGKYLRYKN